MKLELGSGYSPTPGYLHCDANDALPGGDVRFIDHEGCTRREPHVDVHLDASKPLFFADGQVEEIRAVDVLEHISWRRSTSVLREWARVLKPGGRLFVQVPDFGQILEWCDTEHGTDQLLKRTKQLHAAGVIDEIDEMVALNAIVLGGHEDGEHVHVGDDWRWNAHYALFDERRLARSVNDAGLLVESCVTNAHPNLQLWAVKPRHVDWHEGRT